jgi:hypothetical protein
MTDIFCGLLGYAGPAEAADTYTLSRERHVEADSEFANAVLGRFQKGVVLELPWGFSLASLRESGRRPRRY